MHPTEYLKAKEVQERLKIGETTFYELIKQGILPRGIRFGGAIRWRLSELEAAERNLAAARGAA